MAAGLIIVETIIGYYCQDDCASNLKNVISRAGASKPGQPQENLLEILSGNDGALGMNPSQASRRIVDKAHRLGIIVYIYCIDSLSDLASLLKKASVDVVFSNTAQLILEGVGAEGTETIRRQ